MAAYVSAKGDFITVTFDPQSGHEQRGRRPPLVLSNRSFNQPTGMAIVCPITNTDRGVPFHLPVPASASPTGFVMVEQVKSVDYDARHAKFVEAAPFSLVEDAIAIVEICVQ